MVNCGWTRAIGQWATTYLFGARAVSGSVIPSFLGKDFVWPRERRWRNTKFWTSQMQLPFYDGLYTVCYQALFLNEFIGRKTRASKVFANLEFGVGYKCWDY